MPLTLRPPWCCSRSVRTPNGHAHLERTSSYSGCSCADRMSNAPASTPIHVLSDAQNVFSCCLPSQSSAAATRRLSVAAARALTTWIRRRYEIRCGGNMAISLTLHGQAGLFTPHRRKFLRQQCSLDAAALVCLRCGGNWRVGTLTSMGWALILQERAARIYLPSVLSGWAKLTRCFLAQIRPELTSTEHPVLVR